MKIDENFSEDSSGLRNYSEQIKEINRLALLIPKLYLDRDTGKLVRGTEVEVKATLILLDVLSDIYNSRLVIYKSDIDELNKIPVSKDIRPVKQIYVRQNVNKYEKRNQILNNYKKSLKDVSDAYDKLLERAKLIKPHYDDPIFQGDMNYFLFQINTMIQNSKELSG